MLCRIVEVPAGVAVLVANFVVFVVIALAVVALECKASTMFCANPTWIKVGDFSGDHVHIYGTHKYKWMPVRCRKCIPCLEYQQKMWMCRLIMEREISDSAFFITLTYRPEDLEPLNIECVQSFIHSLRVQIQRKFGKSELRYFGCGEYGREHNRPHYHLILFNVPAKNLHEIYQLCLNYWHKGFVYVEYCTNHKVKYITKYITKLDPRPHEVAPFIMMSRHPGLGYRYFEKFPAVLDYIIRSGKPIITFRGGFSYTLPRYFRERYFPQSLLDEIAQFAVENKDNNNFEFQQQAVEYHQKKLRDLKRKYFNYG